MYAVADANKYLHKLPTLLDMMAELQAPYGEVRYISPCPSDEEAFYLRHGETRQSLKVSEEGLVIISLNVLCDHQVVVECVCV